MLQKLRILYNTLKEVETRGDSTKQMALSLQFLEGLIKEAEESASATPPVSSEPEHVTAEVVE